jgi:hypothetical protein
MSLVYKYSLLALVACTLISCKSENVGNATVLHKKPDSQAEAFVRDTSAYVTVVDTSVHDSAFREEIVSVDQGGFTEYFAGENQKNTPGTKIFYAYSDSTSPFVRNHSDRPTFVDMVALAYARHYAMEISPDDIWLMILDGFRLHVKSNSDALKDRFVGPAVNTDISVSADWLTLESTHEDWFDVITALFDSLQKKLPVETGTPLQTKFSTTSSVDYNISRSMVLAIASEYYTYSVYTMCGIPKIKINGTKQDWELLRDSFNKLASRLDMDWWAEHLNPILDEFVNVFEGKTDLDFWKGIYKRYVPELCSNPTFNGWLSKFYPYLSENSYKNDEFHKRTEWENDVDFERLPKIVTAVDINWEYLGQRIPLKLYTGFIGIQVDTTTNTLKASRGYALRSLCGWCSMKRIANTVEYIPGKAYRLHELLALSDSINFYDKNGLAFATRDSEEIENFAKASELDEENPYFDLYEYRNYKNLKPVVLIDFYRKGMLVDRLRYFNKLNSDDSPESFEEWIMKILNMLSSNAAVQSSQGTGVLQDNSRIEKYFKKHGISTESEINEFKDGKDQPKPDIYMHIQSFVLKEGKTLEEDSDREDLESGLKITLKNTCGWRLERAFYRHYKKGFKLSVEAELTFGKDGRVTNVEMNTEDPVYKEFLDEVKSILYYGWMPPEVVTELTNRRIAQDIIQSEKVYISFSEINPD